FKFITYEPASIADHKEIVEILDDLLTYTPEDVPPSPVSAEITVDSAVLSDRRLVVENVDIQRRVLTALVHKAVKDSSESENAQVREIKSVCDRYPRSMQSAWLVRPED